VKLMNIEVADSEPARWIETGPLGFGPAARRLQTPFSQRRRWADMVEQGSETYGRQSTTSADD